MKQYSPKIFVKRELELWCIADISGYIYAHDLYQGNQRYSDRSKRAFGLTGSAVY